MLALRYRAARTLLSASIQSEKAADNLSSSMAHELLNKTDLSAKGEDTSELGTALVPARGATSRAARALALLRQAGLATDVIEYRRRETIFSQGDRADALLLLRTGMVKISVISGQGKEAVLDIVSAGAFLGEECIAHSVRSWSAEVLENCSAISIKTARFLSSLRKNPDLALFFATYLVERNLRTEADLANQLFSSSEKRLARTLVRLAEDSPTGGIVVPEISQETLARMVGTTRSRVSFFINKFRRQGLIHYDKGLKIDRTLVTIASRD